MEQLVTKWVLVIQWQGERISGQPVTKAEALDAATTARNKGLVVLGVEPCRVWERAA
jgi:hypothetical protein